MFDGGTWVSLVGAVLGFAATLTTGLFVWFQHNKTQTSKDADDFRGDLLEFTETLQKEMSVLRDRIGRLETDVMEKNKTIIKLELRLAVVARALINNHGVTLEQLLGESANE